MDFIFRLSYRRKRQFSSSLTFVTAVGAVLTVAGPMIFPCPATDRQIRFSEEDFKEPSIQNQTSTENENENSKYLYNTQSHKMTIWTHANKCKENSKNSHEENEMSYTVP